MNKPRIANLINPGLALGLTLTVYGCGRGPVQPSSTLAQQSDIAIQQSQPGMTPFIASVEFTGQSVIHLTSAAFTISAKPNSVSQPVNVTWSRAALLGRGYLQNYLMSMPVFGLYQNYQNQVSFQLTFDDGSTQQLQSQIATTPYTDPFGVFLSPTIVKARAPASSLGFNFFIMKTSITSPVIVDTDGNLRWVVPAPSTPSVYFADGQFITGINQNPLITTLQFDGTESSYLTDLPQPLLASFTHNIDPGLHGVLAEFYGTDDLGASEDDIVSEIAPSADQAPYQTYDMADIVSSYMRANGDDAAAFVRPGFDWFHVNASTYDPSDNSVIISSREDFLIKLNYSTHEIIWILGDPTKYWYTFPSLKAKALTLDAGGEYPIGQHAVSITSDGYVMLFNDGLGSLNEPVGTSPGVTRNYSEVNAYSIDASKMTAHQAWKFDYGQSIFSPICGSVYEANQTYLVDFATAHGYQQARLVGLDSNLDVVFDFQYASPSPCGAAWNAIPVPLENMQIE